VRLKLASRKSDLARWQAVQVGRALETLPENPSIEFIFKASLGDQDLDTPLANMGAKGVFTEDFHQDLLEGRCDLVVHSWKDLPVEPREQTEIAMTLPRADVRDLLLVPEEVWQEAVKTGTLKILTSSPRRVYNLSACLAKLLPAKVKLEFVNVRGNVPTRLTKMRQQNSALILAKAGLDRLLEAEASGFEIHMRALIENCRFMVLPISLNPAAAAQGALAIEILRTNEMLKELCGRLSDLRSVESVNEEREILQSYGGGCHQKIGVTILQREFGRVLSLRGITDQGEILHKWRVDDGVEWARAKSADAVFPHDPKENSWFERQELPCRDLAEVPALFVARADALPTSFKASGKQILWTSGVASWQKLALRGLWVNGTFDGLGENEDPALEQLCGPVHWAKVTHKEGRPQFDLIATYELIPRKIHPDLRGKTHFYWMSTSSFERARQLFPQEIEHGYNACGPGSTWSHLMKQELKHRPKVFVGIEQFREESDPRS